MADHIPGKGGSDKEERWQTREPQAHRRGRWGKGRALRLRTLGGHTDRDRQSHKLSPPQRNTVPDSMVSPTTGQPTVSSALFATLAT